ncbi:hypothetical protein C882_1135 [Caenispirillum salinarum AK4]|uniref:Uncharacterized protein n=1 Tax=Caenispirillum salinarum AK4 TaxID=1238182 RepID=K9GTT7_9PROT|nr:ACT domain-containing protein [Caenispirillum salinarum]EKV28134.1 hypothetical protein C882_1135 [Caenispirillum salinarum AK4]
MDTFTLTLMPEALAVCRLPANAAVPDWAWRGPFQSVTRTGDELSIVCGHDAAPANGSRPGLRVDGPWRVFKLHGPFAFDVTGVVSTLTAPLAEAGVGVFVLSTYDTDWILVKEEQAPKAAGVLREAGHDVRAGA